MYFAPEFISSNHHSTCQRISALWIFIEWMKLNKWIPSPSRPNLFGGSAKLFDILIKSTVLYLLAGLLEIRHKDVWILSQFGQRVLFVRIKSPMSVSTSVLYKPLPYTSHTNLWNLPPFLLFWDFGLAANIFQCSVLENGTNQASLKLGWRG